MLRKIFLPFVLILTFTVGQATNIKAYFSYAVFTSPGKGPYIETYLTISGNSVKYKKEKGKYLGAVHVTMTFKRGGEIVKAASYNLSSPDITDTLKRANFIDQQRFFLVNGTYEYEISIQDNNAAQNEKFTSNEIIEINQSTTQIQISDIQLLESYSKSISPSILTKSGYDLIPYGVNYYPDEMTKLAFYTETYNTNSVLGEKGKFAFVYYIESSETLDKMEGFHSFSKQECSPVNVLLSQFDIKSLPSGNYNLVVEVKDNANMVQGQKKVFFQRKNIETKIDLRDIAAINPNETFVSRYENTDTLKDMIRCIWPISSTTERDWQNNQIANADNKAMQQFIFAFWKNRNESYPEQEWLKYKEQVRMANELFRDGKTPGYFTERGRVYLQYGPPDSRQEVPNEADSYPYEIWQYYRMKDPATGQFQTNKKYVFYNKDIAGNNFKILHSDARGELKDARWELKLKQRTQIRLNLDEEKPNSTYGSGADDLFSNPR